MKVKDSLSYDQIEQMADHPEPDYLPVDFDKPNIMIAGPSGSGKSTSLRNLDPNRTIILNTEQKALPFRAASKFRKSIYVESFGQFKRIFDRALNADSDYIVIDSFTSLTEFAYQHFVRHVEKVGDNVMAAWAAYKDEIHDILLQAKRSDKYVIFIGVDDFIQDEKNRLIKSVSVQGSLKGKVEKEFTICLWTRVIENDDGTMRYVFATNSDGSNKAKTPMEMFNQLYIDNDLAQVIKRIETYYSEDIAA